MMRIAGFSALIAVLALTACAAPRVVQDAPLPADGEAFREPPAEQAADGTVSEALYQPTVHGIVALQGGYGTQASARPVATRWRRGGTGQEFTLTLDPDQVTVQAVEPGRYVLVAAETEGGEFVEIGNSTGRTSPALVVDPGEVVYAGKLYFKTGTARPKPEKKGKKKQPAPPPMDVMTVEVRDQAESARAALKDRFPQQAGSMKKRLLAAK